MTNEPIQFSAVYEGGVLRPQGGPISALRDGERVEVLLVRTEADADETERRARALRAADEQLKRLAAQPAEPDDDYDVLRALTATRLEQGERPLIPPTGAP